MSSAPTRSAALTLSGWGAVLLALLLALAAVLPPMAVRGETAPDHLVISEVVTGGSSASDELIEVYNPTPSSLPLEGLELIYVTASGATISRRASWELGAPSLGPGRHLLVANELGIYAPIADAQYASGMAATGGSVALRIQGASSAVDAVGWGTAASSWMEGAAAPASSPGSSLERLPGGMLGSTQDTGVNQADFAVRPVPDPQNAASPPVPVPGGTPLPSTSPEPSAEATLDPTAAPTTPSPTPSASIEPTPTPGPDVTPIATARGLPDGMPVTVEGVALTGSAFTDGGGYVADGTGGIAVLVTDASFDRGARLRLAGTVDDRFSQRTLRVEAADLQVLGAGSEPPALVATTGSIGEAVEGELVRVGGALIGGGTILTTGTAFDLDDGSGATRVIVATGSGIDLAPWKPGTAVDLVGVVGQRDSTGTGSSGYRVQPRDPGDIRSVEPSPTATPSPSGGPSTDPSPSASPPAGVLSIAAARALPKSARATVRGIVTLPPGVVDPATAVLQDGSGAIVLRIGDEVGPLRRGRLLQVEGTRSTKSGMETLRVTVAPRDLGSGSEPATRQVRTGEAGEADEARLVTARGALVASARRNPSGTVSFEIDDGSGPLRVLMASSLGADASALTAGTWIEVRGVLGQETTGAQPLRGYRVWPRDLADVRVTAVAGTPGEAGAGESASGPDGTDPGAGADLADVGAEADPGLRVGATLVSGPWPELHLGGLLWDGARLMALEESASDAVDAVLAGRRAPLAVELVGPRAVGEEPRLGLPLVRAGAEPGAIAAAGAAPSAPSTKLPSASDPPRWVAFVGRMAPAPAGRRLLVDRSAIAIDRRCEQAGAWPAGIVGVTGIAIAEPLRIVASCAGVVAAPWLARPALPAGGSRAEAESATLAGLSEGSGSPADRPILPSALLALAAAGLMGAVAIARRLRTSSQPPTDPGDASSAPPAAPTLTLVPLPHERAP